MNDLFLTASIIAFIVTVALVCTIIVMLVGFGIWEWWHNRKIFFPKQTDWDNPE